MGGQIDVVYAVIEYVDYEGYKEPVGFLLDAEEAERIAQIYMETYKNTTYEVVEIDNLKQVSGYFKAVADSRNGITVTRGVTTYEPDPSILYADAGEGRGPRVVAYGATEMEAVTRVLIEFGEKFPEENLNMQIRSNY